jgi:cell wall-associated NlpC family hydrolase
MRFDARSFPGSPDLRAGFANCQTFAYALLRHFGRTIPDFRSRELWDDAEHTFLVERYEPLDLIFFNRTQVAFGAHVGVFIGENSVLHLARRVGAPAVWSLRAFAEIASYRVLLGGKRTRK